MNFFLALFEALPSVLYHGCPNQDLAQKIIKDGAIVYTGSTSGGNKHGRSFLSPIQGSIYLTPSISYAQIYALGAHMAGHDMTSTGGFYESRYGYLFVIDSESLESSKQPDEDDIGRVGSAYHRYLLDKSKGIEYSPQPYEENLIYNLFANKPLFTAVGEIIRKSVTPKQWEKIGMGEYAYWAAGGKKALKAMSPSMKQEIMNLGSNIAYNGAVGFSEVWKVDKVDCPRLKKDGSTFFDVATRIL